MTGRSLPSGHISRRSLLAGAAGTGLVGLLAACSASSTATKTRASAAGTTGADAAGTTPAASVAPASASASASTPAKSKSARKAREVSVQSIFDDGTKVGVGMPIVLLVDPAPTDAAEFVKAAKVKVNGKLVKGAWRWSTPYAGRTHAGALPARGVLAGELHDRPRTADRWTVGRQGASSSAAR